MAAYTLKADQRSQAAGGTTSAEAALAPAVSVTLSDAAKRALAGAAISATSPASVNPVASKAVDSLLVSSGSAIYTAAISSLKTYPPDIALKLDNPNLSDADRRVLDDKLNAREHAAYFHLAGDTGLNMMKAYIEYYDSLSPEEQNSARYRGTRENAVTAVNNIEVGNGKPKGDYSMSRDPILSLFDAIKKSGFNVDDKAVHSMLQNHKAFVSTLNISKTDPNGTAAKVSQASARFNAVQKVVDTARSGDSVAFTHLQELATLPNSIANFVTYASSLTTAKTA